MVDQDEPFQCITSWPPTAHTSFGAMAATPVSTPSGVLGMMDQALPSQCMISAGGRPPQLCGGVPPTAQISLGESAAMAKRWSELSSSMPEEGVATRFQAEPSQCSMKGPPEKGPPEAPPTAQAFVAESAATPRSSTKLAALLASGVSDQRAPS